MEDFKKPFKSFDQQINYLESLNLRIRNRTEAKRLLKQYNYYMLINNYDLPFRTKSCVRSYEIGASLKMIYQFYNFDTGLKELLLKYIFVIEKTFKTLIAYYFSKLHGCSENEYLKYEYYFNGKMIETLQSKLNLPHNREYKEKNNHVPLWVVINDLTFGELVELYSSLDREIQNYIILEFPYITTEELEIMLRLLNDCRNLCAHNKLAYCFSSTIKLTKMEAHSVLKAYNKENSLIDTMVAFKYLLYNDIYKSFHIKLISLFDSLRENLSTETDKELYIDEDYFYKKIINLLNLRNLDWERLLYYRPSELDYYKGKCGD